ncbi:probable membrane-associated kinase regulator 2 [Typha angustifolia]|uniref:probable membrane-associated kinase regulator 2 n=1 Tax=Typha angustifolia TaxID=59011 RepID=UPI003C2B4505
MQLFALLKPLKGGGRAKPTTTTITIADSVFRASTDTDEDGCGGGDDDGPFFDLEFAIPSHDDVISRKSTESATDSEEEAKEFDFAASILKAAAKKIRVFQLGFRKAKPSSKEIGGGKLLVKLNIRESPLVSLFARDSGSRSSDCGSARSARVIAEEAGHFGSPSPDEGKPSRHVMIKKYLSKIKASRGHSGGDSAVSLPAGFRVVATRLRKSRSASSAVAAVRSPPPPRRDDSLIEQQDGIQSAIAHCKRSFNKGSESPLVRSRSDPGEGNRAVDDTCEGVLRTTERKQVVD